MNIDKTKDKQFLTTLCEHLECSKNRLHLDAYRDWNIQGTKGHIFTDLIYWYVYLSPESTRKWNNIKNKLSFMEVSQDGDDEGILKMKRMPSKEEAKILRKLVGLRISTKLTEEEVQQLKERFLAPAR
jgi:hypothetical protein